MVYYGRKVPVEEWVEAIGWFGDKICLCKNDNGVYHNGFDWATMNHYVEPPICRWCNKWENRMHKCAKCDVFFYQFFNHPRSGYHHRPRVGWYCWNCLQTYLPPEVETVSWKARPITPPPAMVLPPGYELVEGVGYR